MTTESFDMTDTIIPKSDQLNAEDILTGPVTITIMGVTRGNAEQPVNFVTAEFGPGRPYKPSKTMRRVIVNAWGKDAAAYVGRRIRIYRDPEVRFGPDKVGGIKISHLSHIDKRLEIALTVTRGRRAPFTVDPLPDESPPATPKAPSPAAIIDAFKALGVTLEQLEARVGSKRDQWTPDDTTALATLGNAIKAGDTTVFEEFTPAEPEQATLDGAGDAK
jgi:hypothetical protein